MRTLSEIIEAAKVNQPLDIEEAQYAICALESLSVFDRNYIQKCQEKHDNKFFKPFDECFNRWKTALNKSPKDWLGLEYDPKDPAVQKRRQISINLYTKIVNNEL